MIPFPNKKYDIIYADPPWWYSSCHGNRSKQDGRHVSDHYELMKTPDICALPVQDIAADNCLLFLWATGACFPDAMKVGKAWGFQWATFAFVWDKQTAVVGHYTMSTCEYCTVWRRGKIPKPRGPRNIRQLISVKRGAHSVKPMEVRHRIDKMFPTQSKIELFARGILEFEGWDFWGNEV